jgi:hypothetical protein
MKSDSVEIDRSMQLLVNMSKVLALKLEGGVVSAKNAFQETLVASSGRNHKVEFTHTLLQITVSFREASENRVGIAGTA